MKKNKQCLILTATILPNSNYVVPVAFKTRKDEYLKVLKYYYENFEGDIYFVENSEFDFTNEVDFNELFNQKSINLIQTKKSNEIEKGKGYQEFEMLDGVISRLANRYDEFIKISGRYLVVNFKPLVCQKNCGIIIDRHHKKNIAITSFFRCKFDLYMNSLQNCFLEVNDSKGVFIEHIVYKRLESINKKTIDLFSKTPIYEGVSGSYGGSLNRNPLKTKIRNVERIFLKFLNLKKFVIEY